MQSCFYLLLLIHFTEGCKLSTYEIFKASSKSGGSILLPCSCADLQLNVSHFKWEYRKPDLLFFDEIYPNSLTNRFVRRVRIFNSQSSGNLSLLLLNLTEEDSGTFKCTVNTDFRLFVVKVLKDDGTISLKTTTATSTVQQHSTVTLASSTWKETHKPTYQGTWVYLLFLPPVLMMLILVLGGLLIWVCREQRKAHTDNKEEQGEWMEEKGQDSELLYASVAFKANGKTALKQEDVVYSTVSISRHHSSSHANVHYLP